MHLMLRAVHALLMGDLARATCSPPTPRFSLPASALEYARTACNDVYESSDMCRALIGHGPLGPVREGQNIMAEQERRGTGNTGNHETLGGNRHLRATWCAPENIRPFEGVLDELLNADPESEE